MTSRLGRILFIVSCLVFVTSACASSEPDEQADSADSADTADTAEASPAGEAGEDDATDPTPEATSIPVPENDSAAEAAIAELDGDPTPEPRTADRHTTARDFVRLRFNIDPDPEWIRCMVAETERDETLDEALQTPSVGTGEVDDTQLRALTSAMNGCIATISLADWATQAIGPQGDVRETAPACLGDRFDDEESGDLTFYNFVALTYQFRLDPAGVDGLVDSLSTCAPITSLSEFFASTAEQTTGFATVVDRDCLNQALSPAEVSQDFWTTFVDGRTPPVEVITPYTDACSGNPYEGLDLSVPEDFEPWSGVGALAGVVPDARALVYDTPPPMTIDPARTYEAILVTAGGEIRLRLFADTAPIAVNNFVNLARDGYFDRTVFHRVLPDFMAQGGDPTGIGTGGPGYVFEDEVDDGPPLDRKGLVAMANSGPDSNGSQFFITFGPTEWLNGLHTVFGEVIEGVETLDAIELRDPQNPTGRGQELESVTIIES